MTSLRSFALLGLSALLGCPAGPPDEPFEESAGTRPVLDWASTEGFWESPFPSDLRVTDAGRPDLTGFPNPGGSELLDEYLAFASEHLDGFGQTTPVWFPFDGPVVIPRWDEEGARASARCEGPVRIVDVDPASPARGTCLPAWWRWIGTTGDPFLRSDVLVVQPLWGFVMRPATTYAAYLVDLPAPDGYVRGGEALEALLRGEGSGEQAAVYAPLADYVASTPGAIGTDATLEDGDPRWIASATVFTTRDATAELGAAAAFVKSDPDYPRWDPDSGLVEVPEDHPEYRRDYRMFMGTYTARNFQEGEVPYAQVGGGFVWDGQGQIVPQRDEDIPFVVAMPDDAFTQPAEGWPVLLHSHGTGGDRWSHLTGNGLVPGALASDRGFLQVAIPQPIHDDRWPGRTDLGVDLNSFNYFNPDSGTTMFRQAALDILAQVKFVKEQMADGGALAERYPEMRIDPERIFFLGHSQGGLTGGLALAFDDDIKAWALSGAGGGLPMTIMLRENPLVIRDALLTALGSPEGADLFEQHPVVALVGTLTEVTDPIVYAPGWAREATRPPASILLTEGIHDEQTPAPTSEALAISAGLPIARPHREQDVLGLELRGLDPLRTPYSGNFRHPSGAEVTLGLAQFDSDHFAIFREAAAGTLWANFMFSHARDGAPGELGFEL